VIDSLEYFQVSYTARQYFVCHLFGDKMKPKPEFSKYQIKLIDMIIENNYSTKP